MVIELFETREYEYQSCYAMSMDDDVRDDS